MSSNVKDIPTTKESNSREAAQTGNTKEVVVTGKELGGDKESKARDSYVEKLNKEQEEKQKKGLTKGDSETAKINQKLESIDKKTGNDKENSGLNNEHRTDAPLATILRHDGNTTKEGKDALIQRESHIKGHENAKGEEDIEQKYKDSRI